MHDPNVVTAGFLVVRSVPRPDYVSADLIPSIVVSGSSCICPQFPSPNAISWVIASDEDRSRSLAAVGLGGDRNAAAIEWATASFDVIFGWPSVFRTLEAATAARSRFLASNDSIVVLGLGLPEQFVSAFLEEATPELSPPGYAPMGESGYLECVKHRVLLPDGGRRLGFEPLNLQLGMIEDSWLCNGLEQHCFVALGIRPSPNGLIETFEDATACVSEISREQVGAEPGPWYPFLLVEYDSPTTAA